MEPLPSDIFHNFFQYSLKKRGYIEINCEEEAGGIIHLKQPVFSINSHLIGSLINFKMLNGTTELP